jgi:hypothetical protein
MNDFDALALAAEEMEYCAKLEAKPIEWVFGVRAYQHLLQKLNVAAPPSRAPTP